MRVGVALALCALLVSCDNAATDVVATSPAEPTARVVLVGDVMLGRGVASVIAADTPSVFAGVRHLIAGADIAAANLESPLTLRPHVSDNVNALEADPATGELLAATGFDVMSLPNNHSGDAGPDGLLDTISALDENGIAHVGAGANTEVAAEPIVLTASGISVGFLAFDTTGVGAAAGSEPGIMRWDDAASPTAVRTLRNDVDVVIVSIHGGTEYLPTTDPSLAAIANVLTEAGADVVWGHGAHVVQSVTVTPGERPSIVATSLGNFLFDQFGSERTTGYLLEVMVDADGIVAYRVGVTEHPDRRVEFVEWLEPVGDAVWVEESWWSLLQSAEVAVSTAANLAEFRHGDLVAATLGDIDGDGDDEVVASFRRPHRTTTFMQAHPEVQWADARGRSAHLGVYYPDDLTEIWVAGSVLMPVASLEVCDGSLAIVHDQLDDPAQVATGAWIWNGFGFDTAPTLPGNGTPACADIDGDGQTDPVILERD